MDLFINEGFAEVSKYYMLKIPYIETILYICKQKEITTPK